jgi:hypothetical protein
LVILFLLCRAGGMAGEWCGIEDGAAWLEERTDDGVGASR